MKNTKHLQANTMSKVILSVLFLLMPFVALAQVQPKLVTPDVTVKAGQPFEVSVQDAPAGSGIQWTWDSRLKCTKTFSHILSCILERPFLTEESLNVEVGATIDKLKWSGTGVVTIDKTGGIKTKTTWETGVSDVGKLEKINGLLKELQSGELSEARILDFYKKMGDEKLSMKDLIEFKDSVIKGKHKELGYYKHGVDFWNQNFRQMEMQIMNVRKEMVLKAWDATIKQYFRDNPEGCKIYKMDVGGWVKETLEKMKFEGDIDFTIIMERSEDAIRIRNIFEGEIQKIFKLDMVAVDAIATAHRAATLAVYIGEYGADWAEKDAIKRGKMQAIEYEDGRIVIREEVPPTEKQTIFSILKNNEGMRKGQPDMLAQIKQEKADPKPTYNMEPGISLEFLRHVTEDAIHQRLAPHEKLIRICKYLDRSAKEHASIMETFGVKPQPINPALIKASADIIAVKQDPKLNPEETYLKIMLIGESLMGSAWLNDPEAFLQKLGQRAAEVMKHNIEMALEQRLKRIEGAKDLQEKDAEKRKLLDELENEFKAFSEGNVEFPPKAKSVMIELATYFKNKGLAFKLSPEEQKRIAELLKRLTDNPKASRTWTAMIWQHVQTLHAGADTAINEMNNLLDVLDNHTIEKLRMTEGIEIEVGGKKIKPMNIKAVNQYLNGTVLGTIGNNTAYKGINLAMETKAYWDAVMNAETWSEGFKNLGYEVMTRRLPGYALTETFVMGNYGRMSLELVYLFCPLTAVPEGLYGMAQGAAEWGVGKMNQWRYEELVEALYDSATFEKTGERDQFKEWKMTGFTYDCPPVISPKIDAKTKSKEGLFDLVNSCKKVSVILYSQIKNHPAVVQFEEMLSNPAVSSGKASIMGVGTGWPYQYAGLSKYGEGLYKIYRKKVDDVTLEYFKGVIDGLEKRKSWEVGTGYAKIMEIEKELGCTRPLMEYTKGVGITGHVLGGDNLKEDVKNDAKRFQEVVDTYNKLKESNKAIAGLKERWQAEFLEGLKPGCSPASIKETDKRASELSGRLTKAVEEAKAYVDKVIGKDSKEDDIRPITKARLCMAYYSYLKGNSSSEYSRCYEDYQQAKAEVDKKAVNVVMAEIDLPKVEFCVGEKVTPAMSYNKSCDECRVVAWEILDDQGRVEERLQPGTKTTWKPRSAGDKTIRAKVEIEFVKDVVKFERTPEKKVSVKPEGQCPKLKIALDSGGITEITKDSQITVSAKPLSLAPGSPPLKRYFWTEDGQERPSTETPDYIVSGKGKGNRSVTLEAVARDADGNLSEKAAITIGITDQATAGLLVKIVPVDMEAEKDGTVIIKDNRSATFKAVVSTKIPLSKKESGELIFRWSADKTKVFGEDKNTATFKGEGWSGKKVQIDVVVMDAKKREGTASIIVDVKASQGLAVIFEDHPKTVTERDVLKLRVMEPIKTTGNYRYTWKRNGAVVRDKMEPDYFDISDFQGLAGKSVTFVVEVFDDKGRTGSAETTIKVTEPKPEVEKLKVSVSPDYIKIKEDGDVELTCSVEPFKDSGKLSYYWAEYPEPTEKKTFRVYGKDTKYKPPVTVTVTVRVKDEKGREGEATANVYVEAKAAKDEPSTGKKWDDAISSASKDWKRLIAIRDEIEKIKPLDKAAVDKVNAALSVLAEASQQYLKDCLNYLPVLKEKDRIAFAELKKGVTGSLTRECLKKEGMCPCPADNKLCWQNCCAEYVNQNYLRCLGDAEMENSKNQKALQKKISIITDSSPYSRYQEYKGMFSYGGYKDYFIALDKVKGEVGLPDPLPAQPVLAWSYGSPCGGAGDLGIKPSTGLDVSLSQYIVTPPLKPGGKVKLTATIKGGKPPYKYSWSGTPEGKDESVTYTIKDMGEQTITVDVTDVGNLGGTGKITVTVTGEEGKIQGLPNQVVYGTVKEITVSVGGMSQSAQAEDPECAKQCEGERACFAKAKKDPNVRCMPVPDCDCAVPTSAKTEKVRVVWQSDPPITFDPSTSSGSTKALFDRMPANGRIRIWGEIQKETAENVYSTAGRAKDEEVTVVPPKFKWSFVPEKGKGKVGEEVKVTITTEPKIDPKLIDFKWDYPESSNRMEYETNASVIGFVPKDPKPFMLLVSPQVPYYKELIGGALKEEYQAGAYTVTVGKPRNIGSKPQIWVCDTQLGGGQKCGLQEKEYEFAVYHNISMNADVAPAPSETPRFQWVVSPEGCRVHNELSQELTVDCSNTGAYTATITVRDKNNTVLGTGSGSFNVTISQQMLNESKKKAEEAKKDQTDKE
ncbi:MAG TPA: hypothetical protein VN328_11205, partial [Thermodesulfovibrionales bacterium]|nr:hypothetical protein [Thermodesulfovibrionales bacterium]